MGRPLAKRFFGNFNIGTDGYTAVVGGNTGGDDGIGGEGLAGVTLDGSEGAGNYVDRLPSVTSIAAPTLPGGVTASGAVTFSTATSANLTARGTGYRVGDVLTDTNGTTWTVTELEVASFTLDPAHQGADYAGDDTIPYANGININLDGVNGGGTPNGAVDYTRSDRGSWTTAGAPPTNTGVQIPGLGGTGAQWDLVWGVKTVTPLVSPTFNDDDGINTGALATTATPSSGRAGATVTVSYQVASVTFAEKGSGYVGSEAIAFTTAPGGGEVRATGTVVLTTDVGARATGTNRNVDANQDNAIVIYANVGGEGGTLIGDIQAQKGTRRYKVKTSDGVAVCKLVADGSPGVNEAYIKATDDNGNTYFVTKLTSHRAVLTQWTNNEADWLFEDGASVRWTFGSTTETIVQIENA